MTQKQAVETAAMEAPIRVRARVDFGRRGFPFVGFILFSLVFLDEYEIRDSVDGLERAGGRDATNAPTALAT
jgi:hypothetical protein